LKDDADSNHVEDYLHYEGNRGTGEHRTPGDLIQHYRAGRRQRDRLHSLGEDFGARLDEPLRVNKAILRRTFCKLENFACNLPFSNDVPLLAEFNVRLA